MFLGLALLGLASAAVSLFTDYSGNQQQLKLYEPERQGTLSDNFNLAHTPNWIPRILKNDQSFVHVRHAMPITECMFVTSEPGSFSYTSKSESEEVCGVYFLTDPDRRVELQFLTLDVSCGKRDLVSVVDGWELNGELFPSEADYNSRSSSNERVSEFCGKSVSGVFLSSQNAALIQYRITERGKGFTVFARFPKLFTPCNVLAVSTNEPFTLRNYGRGINCTYTALYPSVVRVHAIQAGLIDFFRDEPGTLHKCGKISPWDQVQIGGSYGLDTSKLHVTDSICGLDLKSDYGAIVDYGVTSVRLISSGFFENFVTVTMKPL